MAFQVGDEKTPSSQKSLDDEEQEEGQDAEGLLLSQEV